MTVLTPVKTAPLHKVATIEREVVDAAEIRSGTLYVGLEHMDSDGHFVCVPTVDKGDIASSKFAFSSEHLLYGKLRPYLAKIARPNFSGVCSTDILPILPGKNLDRDFLCHFLRQPRMVVLATSRATGANLPRLSPKALSEFEIPLPPISEQRRIAAILDKADEVRAKRRAALEQLNGLTQAMFLEMFGDPSVNAKRWRTQRLDGCIRIDDGINYGVVQPGDDWVNGVPLVRVGDLVGGRVQHSKLKRINPAVEAAYKRSRLRGDEVLVSCVGSIGIVALADESLHGFNIARAVARIPLSDAVERQFIAEYLRTEYVQRYFTRELRTVSQPTLNIKQLEETPVILPPGELQREFALRVLQIHRLTHSAQASRNQLDALFASLQHRAFSGEL